MIRKKEQSNSCNGETDVSRLMKLLGKTFYLSVSYGTSESGASREKIPTTLSRLGYKSGGVEDYNEKNLIVEMKQGYPIILAGYARRQKPILTRWYTKYSQGHAWLAHGLMERKRKVYWKNKKDGTLIDKGEESQWYVLCNWGWYGLADGYYLSNAFNVAEGAVFPENELGANSETVNGLNFQYKVQMIKGIRKL